MPKKLPLLAAAGVLAAAIAAPASAEAALCTADLPGPAGGVWEVRQDGALETFLNPTQVDGHVFAHGHGDLAVNGVEYPTIPVLDNVCVVSANAISFPVRSVGGLDVSRTVSVSGGVLRHVDTITNATDAAKAVDVSLHAEVLGAQHLVSSESGDADAKLGEDEWAVFNDQEAFPYLRWVAGPAVEPDHLDPDDADLTVWEQDGNQAMEGAAIGYDDITFQPGQTRRFLAVSGMATSQAGAAAAADDIVTPLTGFTKGVAGSLANWTSDADGDGVAAFQDDCPTKPGPAPTGCPLPAPPEPQPEEPKPGDAPLPPAQPQAPAVPATPTVPSTRDRTAPAFTVKNLRRTKRGLRPRIDCDEACAVTITVKAGRRTLLTVKRKQRSAAARTIALKVRRARLTVTVSASDAAGNVRRVTRKVR